MRDLVLVQWVDSHMDLDGWKFVDEIDVNTTQGLLVNSVGFVISIEDDAVMLAPNYAEDPEQVSQLMIIPKSAVQNIIQIKVRGLHED